MNLFSKLLITISLIGVITTVSYSQGPDGPCDLPTYSVSHNIDDGIVVFDIYQALLNDQITFTTMQGPCQAWINTEGNNCFYDQTSYNPEYVDGGLCGLDSWELLLTNTVDDCCGSHVIPYYVQLPSAEGTVYYCSGVINVEIECVTECGIIDFTQVVEDDTSSSECIKVCENSNTLAIAPTYSSSGYNYNWVVQGGDVIDGQGENEATISWDDFGTGNIEVVITNSNQNLPPISFQYCIEILEGPEAMFTTPGYACLETPMYFDGSLSNSLSNVTITDFQWDFGDNESGQGETVSHDYDNPGTYTVTLTVYSEIKDDQGNVICICADVYQEDVLVDDLVGPNIYWISTLCEGDASSYWTDAVCGTYIWSVYDSNGTPITNFTGQGTNEIYVTWGQGPYGTIELAVTGCNPTHCTDPTSVQVPIIPATDEISGPDVVCVGEVATYSLTKWNSVDYDWSVTGGTIINTPNSAENTITIQWNTSGSIHVDYSSEFLQCLPNHSANDCMGLADLNVEVKDEWFLSHNASSTNVCLGDVTTFTAYSWNTPINQLTSYWGVDAGANNVAWGTNTSYGINYDVTWTVPGPVVVSVTKIGPNPFCNETIEYYFNVVDVPQPTAIYGPTEVCAQSPEYIYEVDPSSGLNVVWSASANTGTPSLNPSQGSYTQVSWNQSGPFTISASYQMSSAPHCTSDPVSLVVNELTIEPANITGDPACANSIGNYSISPTHADATISWSINPAQYGSILSGLGTNNIEVQWNDISGNTQNVTISAVVELCDNSSIFSEGYTITRAIEPTVLSNDFCEGDIGTVYVDNANDFNSFQWTPGSGINGNFDYQVTNAGEYIVNTVDNNLCPSSGGTTIDLLPTPILNLTTNGPTTICNGTPSSTEIVAPDNPNYTHSWTVNGILQPNTDPTITHNWIGNPLPETYQYVVTVFDGTCYSSETKNISEIANCPPPPPCNPESFNLSPFVTNNSICSEFSFDYTSSSNFTFTGWNFGDGSGSGAQTPTHSYNEIGYYTVSVLGQVPSTNNVGDCNVVEVITVAVQMVAQIGIDISCTPSTALPEVCVVDQSAYLPSTTYSPVITIGSSTSNTSIGGQYCIGSMSPGSVIVGELSATHSTGCVAVATEAVNIPGPVMINSINPACINEEIAFTANCPGTVSFEWNFDDTSTGASSDASLVVNPADPAHHAYAENGLYSGPYNPNVTVKATHANGCEFTDDLTITINDNPQNLEIISTDGDFKYCMGNLEELSLSGTPGGFVTWWEGTSSNSVGVGSTYHATTSGLYGAIITDLSTGCYIILDPVQVDSWPDVPSGISGPSVLCEGDCTDLIAPSGNYSYEWGNLISTIYSTNSSLSLCSYDIPNGDTFSLIITDNISQCKSTSSLSISVEATPIIQAGTYPALPCEGQPITLLVDPVLPDMSYIWTGGNANPYTVLNAGTYTVVGTDTITGCKGTATVEVFPCPSLCEVPSGCYSACEPGKTICAGSEALETYQWNFDPDGNGYSPIPGETDPCFTATQDGMYTLTATNIYGCPKTSNLLDLEFINCDSCQFMQSDLLDLGLVHLGTGLTNIDSDGDGDFEDVACCNWSINPTLIASSSTPISQLCMDITWGDGSPDEYNVPLGSPVEHCYQEGCEDYTITVKIFCCNGNGNSYGFTTTANCLCLPNCYIRNTFWESFSTDEASNECIVEFTGTQFLGPDMQGHQNPSYTITGITNSFNTTINGQYNITTTLQPGEYNVCRTVEGVSELNEVCEFTHCHDIEVDCCAPPINCDLPEEVVFYPEPTFGTADSSCEEGCEWHFCLGGNVVLDDNHCFTWNFGDGETYSSNDLECATHCYSQSGYYDVCLTVYCCDDPDQSIEYCETIEVNCNSGCTVDCPDLEAGLGLISLGNSADASGNSCCEYGLVPELLSDCQIDLFDLCINVDWGDGSDALQNASFPVGYTHCFSTGGTYTVTMNVYCCADGEDSQTWTFTDTVTCEGESPCVIENELDFEWGSNSDCVNGCDEMWFCPLGIATDDLCVSWDYGDGNIYNPPTPDCPIHCYNSSGTYNVCMTAYCCEEGYNSPYNQTVCHEVNVNCGIIDDDDCETCPGDYNSDGYISTVDLLEFLSAFGTYCSESE